jgi:hypothetical protein
MQHPDDAGDGKELGRWILGYLEKGIETPMAQGRSTKVILMIKWIRTRRLSVKNFLFAGDAGAGLGSRS